MRLYRIKTVKAKLDASASTVRRMELAGLIPKRRRVPGFGVFWDADELDDAIAVLLLKTDNDDWIERQLARREPIKGTEANETTK